MGGGEEEAIMHVNERGGKLMTVEPAPLLVYIPDCFKLCPELDSVVSDISLGLSFASMQPSSRLAKLLLKVAA